jgi:hypothetical protein
MVLGTEFIATEDTMQASWPEGFKDDTEEAQSQVYRVKDITGAEAWKKALLSILT